MFQILTSEFGPLELTERTIFVCPLCNTHMPFYGVPPSECVFCKTLFGNLLNILDTSKGIMDYHETGKLDHVVQKTTN